MGPNTPAASDENIWKALDELEDRILDREDLGYLLEPLQNHRRASPGSSAKWRDDRWPAAGAHTSELYPP